LTVVDTSVFVHHPCKNREIEYAAVIGAGFEPVRLVVPRVVIDELDRLKESGNQAVRWRAGHTLGVLDELLHHPRSRATIREEDNLSEVADAGGMPRGKVTIEVFLDDPQHVRMEDNDDEIIDRALALQAYAGHEVRLLTMDTSMALRARLLGLRVHKETRDIGQEPANPEPKPARGDGRAPAQR
jgi:predicted ribonuclease YlaK